MINELHINALKQFLYLFLEKEHIINLDLEKINIKKHSNFSVYDIEIDKKHISNIGSSAYIILEKKRETKEKINYQLIII